MASCVKSFFVRNEAFREISMGPGIKNKKGRVCLLAGHQQSVTAKACTSYLYWWLTRLLVNVPLCVCVWVWKHRSEPACSLAFSWQPTVIALVPARLPRNWHLGNENARCWRGHLIVLGRSERERESERGPSEGKGKAGDAEAKDGPPENRGELLANRHHLRTGLTHLLASFTSEECTEGVDEAWVWGKSAKTWV